MRTESRAGFLAILGLMGLPLVAPAQSAVLTGRVLADSVGTPVPFALVALLVAARIPGVRVVGRGSDETIQVVRLGMPCRRQLIVNGMEREVTLGVFQATDILGLEFHTTSTVPIQHRGTGKRESGA